MSEIDKYILWDKENSGAFSKWDKFTDEQLASLLQMIDTNKELTYSSYELFSEIMIVLNRRSKK